MVRLQYLAILLVLPKPVELALRSHFNGSALHTMTPSIVRKGGVDTVIPAQSWWFLITVECLSTICLVLFFVVILRILFISQGTSKG